MTNNSYINLDCPSQRFSSLTAEIAATVEGTDSSQDEAALNLFRERRAAGSEQYLAETLHRYERTLRTAYDADPERLIGSIRIIECVEVGDTRPSDLAPLSGLLSLIATVFSEDIPCEIYTLSWTKLHNSPFATGIEIVSVDPAHSLDAYDEDILHIAEMLEADNLMIDMQAIKRDFPEVDEAVMASMSIMEDELKASAQI